MEEGDQFRRPSRLETRHPPCHLSEPVWRLKHRHPALPDVLENCQRLPHMGFAIAVGEDPLQCDAGVHSQRRHGRWLRLALATWEWRTGLSCPRSSSSREIARARRFWR